MIIPWIHSTPDHTSNNFFHILIRILYYCCFYKRSFFFTLNTNYLELKKILTLKFHLRRYE